MYNNNVENEKFKANKALKKNKEDTVGQKVFALGTEAMNFETLYNVDTPVETESSSSGSD